MNLNFKKELFVGIKFGQKKMAQSKSLCHLCWYHNGTLHCMITAFCHSIYGEGYFNQKTLLINNYSKLEQVGVIRKETKAILYPVKINIILLI